MNTRIKNGLILLAVILGAFFAGMLTKAVMPANAQTQITFTIGPGNQETWFKIVDESRPPTVVYHCGFIHNFQPSSFGGYLPEVNCYK
ncbi:MAG TPA: hypothetical protein VNB49_10485 [Candidatus Dormibacteraeota bacterium]|nr:hypothetical protein [Candidatus Dormibacteraeota bacterium]